jgi:hypothetical protein
MPSGSGEKANSTICSKNEETATQTVALTELYPGRWHWCYAEAIELWDRFGSFPIPAPLLQQGFVYLQIGSFTNQRCIQRAMALKKLL